MTKEEIIDKLDSIAGLVESYFTTTHRGNEYAILTNQTASHRPRSVQALASLTEGLPVRMTPYPVSGRWTYCFYMEAE